MAIVLLAAILLLDSQFGGNGAAPPISAGAFAHAAIWLVIGLTALNVASTLLECGLGACPDNPVVLPTDKTRGLSEAGVSPAAANEPDDCIRDGRDREGFAPERNRAPSIELRR